MTDLYLSRWMFLKTRQASWLLPAELIRLNLWLVQQKAVAWNAEEVAANGTDKGCFAVDMQAIVPAVDGLARTVLGIKARADRASAEALRLAHVDGALATGGLWKTIAERWRRAPQSTWVYTLR